MPVGQRELRRGIDLGLYPDPERQQRAELAEQRAQLAEQREERTAASMELRDKMALAESLNKRIEFQQTQDAIDLDIAIKERALEAAPKLKGLNPRSKDYPLQRAAALGDDYRVGIVLKDQLAVNDDSYKGWLAIQDGDQKNAAAWEAEHGVEYPRKPDGTLNHVAAGKWRREDAAQKGLTEETRAPGGSTFKAPEPPKPGTPESYAHLAAEKERAEGLRPDKKLTPEQERQFARREQALITAGRQEPAAASSAAPATASVKPKMVRQNGVTYTLQPDGSYK